MVRLLHLAVFVVAVSVVGGCQGDEDDPPRVATSTAPATTSTAEDVTTTAAVDVEPPPLTRAQAIRRLDRICRRSNRALEPFNERIVAAFARDDYEAAADIWERSVRRLQAPFYAKVEALDVPPEVEGGLGRYLDMSHQIDVLGVRYVRAIRRRDDEELSRLDRLTERLANRRTLVTSRLGLTECGS